MDVIKNFLDNYTNENTKYNYRMQLNNFFKALNIKNPDDYFTIGRDYDQDILDFQKSMSKRPPKSIKAGISAVKSFFLANNVELEPKTKFSLRTRRRGSRAWTQDEIFTQEDLKNILQHADAKKRALFLLASSTGCRIGEILQIRPGDIDFEYDPMKIEIAGEYTKTGDPRIVFGSDEAISALKAWMRERDTWLKNNAKKFNKKTVRFSINADDDRLFPFSYTNAKHMWGVLVKKAGYDQRDPRTKRRKYHIHGLRKYFRSRIGIDVDVTEALMGHEGGIRSIYRKYTEEQLAELYKEGMMNLQVFERTPDLTETHKEMTKIKSDNEKLRETLKIMELRMQGLENKLEIEKIKNGKK